jgi:hypothetical protein
MAVLQEASSKSNNPFLDQVKDDVAPAGTWVSTIIDIKDQFGVVRPTFDNPQVTEVVDLTTFLFGFRDAQGAPHYASSRSMKISGNEKSTLFGFLKAILGRAPQYGWDYCELKGKRCLITVAHEQKRNGQGIYPTIAALCPVPSSFALQSNGYGGQGGMAGSTGSPQAGGVPAAMPQAAPVPVAPAPAPLARAPVCAAAADEELPF